MWERKSTVSEKEKENLNEETEKDKELEKETEEAVHEEEVENSDSVKTEPVEEEKKDADKKEEKEATKETGESKKKGFGKKKKDSKEAAYEEKITDLEDQVKRQMAEFENFRKRTEKEKSMMFEMGAKTVIEKLLPVVDNFERGLASISEEEENSFSDGMNKIYKQMMTELDKLGVKPIEALGKEFNPDLHNAVMQVESEEYEEGIIAQELLKGYTYRDTVVRHSMVAVAQ